MWEGMKRIARNSVWSPGGVRPEDWRFRGIFRYVLPLTDLLFLWFGVVSVITGLTTVEAATGSVWQTWWSACLSAAAAACLVGVSFPRLWRVEAAGKIALIGLVSVYIVLMLARGLENPRIASTAGLIFILILLPIWRVGDLGRSVWRRRRLER